MQNCPDMKGRSSLSLETSSVFALLIVSVSTPSLLAGSRVQLPDSDSADYSVAEFSYLTQTLLITQ